MASTIPLLNFIQPSDIGLNQVKPQSTQKKNLPEINEVSEGIALIKLWEGLELEAYPDPATHGPPITIGYGCTRYNDGSPIRLGDTIIQAEAESMLEYQIQKDFLPHIKKISYWNDLPSNCKGSLLSYSWNMGVNFIGDTEHFASINKVLLNQLWNEVPKVLMLYCKGNGRIMLGLKRRRYSEGLLWGGKSAKESYNLAMKLEE